MRKKEKTKNIVNLNEKPWHAKFKKNKKTCQIETKVKNIFKMKNKSRQIKKTKKYY